MRQFQTAMKISPSGAGRVAVVAVLAGVFGATTLAPDAGAVPAKVKRECRDDYKRFCPRYKVGTSRMQSCMRSSGSQLSWGCYEALRDHGYVKRR